MTHRGYVLFILYKVLTIVFVKASLSGKKALYGGNSAILPFFIKLVLLGQPIVYSWGDIALRV